MLKIWGKNIKVRLPEPKERFQYDGKEDAESLLASIVMDIGIDGPAGDGGNGGGVL